LPVWFWKGTLFWRDGEADALIEPKLMLGLVAELGPFGRCPEAPAALIVTEGLDLCSPWGVLPFTIVGVAMLEALWFTDAFCAEETICGPDALLAGVEAYFEAARVESAAEGTADCGPALCVADELCEGAGAAVVIKLKEWRFLMWVVFCDFLNNEAEYTEDYCSIRANSESS